jgi:hypothetical protein
MTPMATANPLNGRPTPSSKRRTNRIAVTLPIGVKGTNRHGQEFTVGAKATNLNHHGGTIVIPQSLKIGTVLTLRNAVQHEASVRVVKEIDSHAGTYLYGVEFMQDVKAFWGIHFPATSS